MQIHLETADLRGEGGERLGRAWQDLEERADGSFFQSWHWIGCLAAERFDAPLLLRASVAGETVGLALFNRHRLRLASRALWLHETGHPDHDSVFIEHNGILLARGHESVGPLLLRAALREGGSVMLSGISAAWLGEARRHGVVHIGAERPAPYADLASGNAAWLARRGAATRSQLARTRKRLGSSGPLTWHQARSVEEALAGLGALADLHQAAWTARGQAGAFARADFSRFHAALIRRAFASGNIMLCWLAAGGRPLAYLLNFVWKDTVLAYQSGFDFASAKASPGLLAHAMAIEAAIGAGLTRYDFLAGDARYKRELADGVDSLYWAELAQVNSLRGLPIVLLRHLREAKSRVMGRFAPRQNDPSDRP